MNLRDQLLKSGLASKEQAKKAQREVSKRQHQKIQEARDPNAPAETSIAEQALSVQREADRLLNLKRNEERLAKEAEARAIDIITCHQLIDVRATEPYYFLVDTKRICSIRVLDEQIPLLEKGELAIASLDAETGFVLVTAENAEKIRAGHARYILCQHKD